jgi:hypothetical protein
MQISDYKKQLIQWTVIVLAGTAVGKFISANGKQEEQKTDYNRASSVELPNKKDSMVGCVKDGLNMASMLTTKKDSLNLDKPLPRKPYD